MMGHRAKLIDGFEWDAFRRWSRRLHPSVGRYAWVKRKFAKRARKRAKREAREEAS